jgi:hypothetical protein
MMPPSIVVWESVTKRTIWFDDAALHVPADVIAPRGLAAKCGADLCSRFGGSILGVLADPRSVFWRYHFTAMSSTDLRTCLW